MKAFIAYVLAHLTRILGIAQGTIALIAATTGIIPDMQVKYWLLASAILTYWRGQVTSNAYDRGVADATAPLPADPPTVKVVTK